MLHGYYCWISNTTPAFVCPPTDGSPVEVAVRAKDHTCVGGAAIGPAREAVQHRLIAGRIDFEHHAGAGRAATGGSPVEVAGRVAGQHYPEGIAAIGPAREAVQHRLIAGRIDFKDDTRARCAATVGSPVEVAGRVADHTSQGIAAIGPTREAVQHGLVAGLIDLKDDTRARCAATVGSPVEVAFRVEDYAPVGVAAIGSTGEAVQHRLVAGLIDLKDDTRARCAATGGSPVEVAFGVEDYTSVRVAAICPIGEVVQHRRMARRIYLVHHAIPVADVRLTYERGPVEVAGRVADHTSGWSAKTIGRKCGEAVQHRLMAAVPIQLVHHAPA